MKITKQQLKRIIREARFDEALSGPGIMRAADAAALGAQIDEMATTFSTEFMLDYGSMTEEQFQNVVELEKQIVLALERLEVLFNGLAQELS